MVPGIAVRHRSKGPKAQLYANILWCNVSNDQARAYHAHFNARRAGFKFWLSAKKLNLAQLARQHHLVKHCIVQSISRVVRSFSSARCMQQNGIQACTLEFFFIKEPHILTHLHLLYRRLNPGKFVSFKALEMPQLPVTFHYLCRTWIGLLLL